MNNSNNKKTTSLRFGVQMQHEEENKEDSGSLGPRKDLKQELKPMGRVKRETLTKKEKARGTFSLSGDSGGEGGAAQACTFRVTH